MTDVSSAATRFVFASRRTILETTAVVAAAILVSCLVTDAPEDAVRYAGGFLQILGVFVVIAGVYSTGKKHGLAGFAETIRSLFRKPQVHISAGSGTISGAGSAAGVGSVVARAGATLDQRVDYLMNAV
jgi:hypothetical protein